MEAEEGSLTCADAHCQAIVRQFRTPPHAAAPMPGECPSLKRMREKCWQHIHNLCWVNRHECVGYFFYVCPCGADLSHIRSNLRFLPQPSLRILFVQVLLWATLLWISPRILWTTWFFLTHACTQRDMAPSPTSWSMTMHVDCHGLSTPQDSWKPLELDGLCRDGLLIDFITTATARATCIAGIHTIVYVCLVLVELHTRSRHLRTLQDTLQPI